MRFECAHSTLGCLNRIKICAKLKCMSSRKWTIRLTLSLTFGIIVMWLPLYAVLGGVEAEAIGYKPWRTRETFRVIGDQLQQYRKTNGRYPKDLVSLDSSPRDGWLRPLLYSLHNDKPLLESLGRDGVRGGVGLDADLSNLKPNPPQSRMTFWARIADPYASKMSFVAGVCGLIGGISCFLLLGKQTFQLHTLPNIALKYFVSLTFLLLGTLLLVMVMRNAGH